MRKQTYDKERVTFNLARYQSHGKTFEVVVDPDVAVEYKGDKEGLSDVLKAEDIFSDAKKGIFAKEEDLQEVFNTKEPLEIADTILRKGEIQLTHEYREEKRNKIINLIHRKTINPQTNSPHPSKRIENALEDAKVHIDEFQSAEEQVNKILDALKPIIPIKQDEATLELKMPVALASSLRGIMESYGKLAREDWSSTYKCELTVPAGLKNDLIEELNNKTKGEIDIKIKGE